MKFLFTFFLLLCYCGINAQPLQWAISIGGTGASPNPGTDERISSVKADEFGNVYICGNVYPGLTQVNNYPIVSNGGEDIFFAKLDCNSNVIWAQTAGGIFTDDAITLELDGYGNLYLAGNLKASSGNKWMFFDTLIGDSAINSWFLAKFDTSGNYIWGRMAQQDNHSSQCQSMILNYNKEPVVTIGTNGAEILPGFQVDTGFHVLNMDTAGSVKSIFRINSSYSWLRSEVFGMDSQSNYYFTSFWNGDSVNFNGNVYYSSHQGSSYQQNYFLFSCDSAGNFRWVKQFTDTISDPSLSYGTALLVDSNDNIYVLGRSTLGLSSEGIPFTSPIGWSSDVGFIIKYDSSGNQLWLKEIWNEINSSGPGGMAFRSNGNIYVSNGFTQRALIENDTLYSPAGTSGNLLLAEFTPTGSLVWHDQLNGNQKKEVFSLSTDIYGNIYMAGAFRNSLFVGPQILTKIGGNTDGFVARWGSNCITGFEENESSVDNQLRIYPNPADQYIRIGWSGNSTTRKIGFLNLLGQEIYAEDVKKGVRFAEINLTDFPSGMYVVRITDDFGKARTSRLVVSH